MAKAQATEGSRMADDVRRHYVLAYRAANYPRSQDYGKSLMPRWDGGRDGNGRRYKSVWQSIATTLQEHRIDPASIIQFGFRSWRGTSPPSPPPDYFKTPDCIQAFTMRRPEFVQSFAMEFQSAAQSLETYMVISKPIWQQKGRTDEQLLISALQDNVSVSASPLFRYSVAMAARLFHVAALFRADALRQYSLSRGFYDEAWREAIPDELKRLVDACDTQGGT